MIRPSLTARSCAPKPPTTKTNCWRRPPRIATRSLLGSTPAKRRWWRGPVNKTTEPLRAAGVIACSKFGRILMVRRTDGEGWAFPGGGLKEGESPEQAAYREFWEETGYRLGSVGKLQMRRIKDGVDFSTFTRIGR